MEERKIAEAQIESFCQYLIREEKKARRPWRNTCGTFVLFPPLLAKNDMQGSGDGL